MKYELNEKTGRMVKVYETTQERLDAQNASYANWRSKLEKDPAKLAEFRARKNAASKKCIANKKAKIAQLEARLAELESNQ